MSKAQDHPARVGVIGLGAVVALLLLALGFAAAGLGTFQRLAPPPAAGPRLPPPPEPRLEADPRVDLAAVRRQSAARLQTYGWADRSRGLAHIPIERAMQIEAARGWADAEPAR